MLIRIFITLSDFLYHSTNILVLLKLTRIIPKQYDFYNSSDWFE